MYVLGGLAKNVLKDFRTNTNEREIFSNTVRLNACVNDVAFKAFQMFTLFDEIENRRYETRGLNKTSANKLRTT